MMHIITSFFGSLVGKPPEKVIALFPSPVNHTILRWLSPPGFEPIQPAVVGGIRTHYIQNFRWDSNPLNSG